MLPGSTIVTEGAVLFFVNCSTFFTCGSTDMWNGIQLKKGCAFFFSNNTFQDAYAAISIESGYKAPVPTGFPLINFMTGNTFDKNVYGVRIGEIHGNENTFFSPMAFYGNKFVSSGTLKNGSARPETGVEINNKCYGTLGTSTEDNVFEDMVYGIRMNNSTVTVRNCVFSRMVGISNTDLGGAGIIASSCYLTLDKSGDEGCEFVSNQNAGILSWRTRGLTVQNTTFSDTQNAPQRNGIKCAKSSQYGKVTLSGNHITMNSTLDRNGIYYERPFSPDAPAGSVINNIVNNVIDIVYESLPDTSVYANGIFVYAKNTCMRDVINIENNIIQFANRPYSSKGIEVLGSKLVQNRGLNIQNNYVYYNYSGSIHHQYANWGIGVQDINSGVIELTNVLLNMLSKNHVLSAKIENNDPSIDSYRNINSVVFCGIHIENSPYLTVSHNYVNKTHRGFHVLGDLSHGIFKCNIMGVHTHGLNCDKGSDMSLQDHRGNIWDDNVLSYFYKGAYYGTKGVGSPPFKFYVNPIISGLKPPSIYPADWFIEQNKVANCGDNIPPLNDEDDRMIQLTYTDQQVITETGTLPLTLKTWDERRTLALRLLYSPVLTDSNTNAAAWLSAATGTSAKRFAEAIIEIQNGWAYSTTWQSSLQSAHSIKTQTEDSIYVKLAAIEQSPEDSILWQQYYTLLDTWQQTNAHIDSLYAQIIDLRHTNFQTIATSIAALPDSTVYEKNLKYILTHLVDVAFDRIPSAGRLDSLYAIGKQCPGTGGVSVREALHWVPFEWAYAYLAEKPADDCDTTQSRNAPAALFAATDIRISPNPAASWIEVQGLGSVPVHWGIFNALGERLLDGQSSGQPVNIDVSRLTSGVYFLTVYVASRRSSARFIIFR